MPVRRLCSHGRNLVYSMVLLLHSSPAHGPLASMCAASVSFDGSACSREEDRLVKLAAHTVA